MGPGAGIAYRRGSERVQRLSIRPHHLDRPIPPIPNLPSGGLQPVPDPVGLGEIARSLEIPPSQGPFLGPLFGRFRVLGWIRRGQDVALRSNPQAGRGKAHVPVTWIALTSLVTPSTPSARSHAASAFGPGVWPASIAAFPAPANAKRAATACGALRSSSSASVSSAPAARPARRTPGHRPSFGRDAAAAGTRRGASTLPWRSRAPHRSDRASVGNAPGTSAVAPLPRRLRLP